MLLKSLVQFAVRAQAQKYIYECMLSDYERENFTQSFMPLQLAATLPPDRLKTKQATPEIDDILKYTTDEYRRLI